MTGRIPSYSRNTMKQVATQLLAKQAQTLDPGYQLQGTPFVAAPHVDVHGKDGLVYLNVMVHGTWVYVFSNEQKSQWLQVIKGETPTVALAYLNTQPGVASVRIDLPFQADHFPTTTNDIIINTDDNGG